MNTTVSPAERAELMALSDSLGTAPKTTRVAIEGGIFYDTDQWTTQKFKFFNGLAESFMSYIAIQPHTLIVDIPADFDPRPVEIKALEDRKEALRAEFAKAVTDIERRISELQAITYEAEVQ